ncbi:hypothetical protein Goarm_023377, partial [Gossypium armourianum]|nr:hypothetical protein [Gossypium armourianum]
MGHLFRECPISVSVWRELSYPTCLQDNQMEFLQWLTWVFSQSSASQCMIFCCALWAIWGDRNDRVNKKGSKSRKEIGRFVHSYILELNEIDKNKPQISITVNKWRKPPDRVVKINFDASYDGRQNKSAVGIVARDREGTVLLSCSEIHQRVTLAFAAEAIACRKALQIGIDMQWEK